MAYSQFVQDVLRFNNIPESDWDQHLQQEVSSYELPTFGQENKVRQLFKELHKSQDAIMISSDVDCDGVTGSVILYKYLTYAGFNVTPQTLYIPNRHEGYGMSAQAIKKRVDEQNIKLIISVDCGIANIEEIAFARKLGVKTVITDHHTIGDTVPDAEITLHPLVHPELNVIKDFSGAGMVFYLCHMIEKEIKSGFPLDEYAAIAAIGIIGDMTQLVGRNRDFVKYGMAKFKDTSIVGLQALAEISKVTSFIDEETFSFKIIPRLNAAGRMGDPIWSFATLATDQYEYAIKGAEKIDSLNNSRKDLCAEYIELAKEMVDHSHPVILISSSDFKHGIVGITAANLVNLYNKPAFVIANEGYQCKGSARTPVGFSTYDALKHADHILEKWGGHKAASGFQLQEKDIDELQLLLNEHFYIQQKTEKIKDKDYLDWKPEYCDGTKEGIKKLIADIILLKPFGQGFKMPEFRLRAHIEKPTTNYPSRKHLFCKVNGIKSVGWNLFKEEYTDLIDLTAETVFDMIVTIGVTDYMRVNPYLRYTIQSIESAV